MKEVRLKNISKIIMGQSVDSFLINDEKNGLEFHQGNSLFNNSTIKKSQNYSECGKKSISNDILVSVRAPVGDLAINDRNLYIGRGLSAIRLYTKHHHKFYYYFINGNNHLLTNLEKGTTFKSITTFDLRNVFILSPSLQVQTAIANYLDYHTSKIDNEVDYLEKKSTLLEEYKQSLIFETVTKGLDKNVPMKDSGIDWIGDIPEHWDVKRVKDIFDIGRGRVISTSEVSKEKTIIDLYPVYSAATENDGVIGYIKTFDFNKTILTWTTDGVKAGTVFFRSGKFNCTNVCGTLFPKKINNNLNYYNWILKKYAPFYKRNDINGGKIMNNEMANIFLTISLPNEQIQIVDFLDIEITKIDKQCELMKKKIELLKEYKQSLIYEAVTGKIEIPQEFYKEII